MADKFRYWACILYPEEDNFPDNFIEILNSLHCNLALSPLHSPDHVPDLREQQLGESTSKKKHYHLVIMWDGPTTQNQIKNFLDPLGPCVTNPFPIFQVNGYIRYLIHLDNPEKEQGWSKDDILSFGNAQGQIEEAFDVGDYDKIKITRDINNFILDNVVTEFTDLIMYAYNNEPKWAYLLDKQVPKSTSELLRSMRYGGRR